MSEHLGVSINLLMSSLALSEFKRGDLKIGIPKIHMIDTYVGALEQDDTKYRNCAYSSCDIASIISQKCLMVRSFWLYPKYFVLAIKS